MKTPDLKLVNKWMILSLLPALLCACQFLPAGQAAPDPAAAATQTAQKALLQSIEQTLTAIPTRTPLPSGSEAPPEALLPTFSAAPLPTPAASETTRISPRDGMRLIYIPAGEFVMGSSKYDRDLETNEVPRRAVTLDAYWISQTQVTNAMYALCVAAGACQYSANNQTNPRYQDPAYADHPVVYIAWQAAADYCAWSGGRLPTEAEWEKAARGTEGQKYAWGNTSPNPGQVNANNLVGDTTPAGQYPEGASPFGVLDMGGNVREWVWDWYDPYYYQYAPGSNPAGPSDGEKKVLKGASYSDIYRFARPANRLAHDPSSPGINRGFRCVYR
jgi:formylglycine-generating enzyme required for sulfatase activity